MVASLRTSWFIAESAGLPTIADADTNVYARCPEADAGTRTILPITMAATLDVSLAGA
jgi:hypothetical protein